jgi:hypothetical protein
MKNKSLKILIILCFTSLASCSQNDKPQEVKKIETKKTTEPHRYGGWYCPDNLIGFPAVSINDWKNVPVVNGRMATKEETQNGTSLIFVDLEKYPDAKPLDIKLPKLARFFNYSSNKEELIIVIQALNISNDSIVGFRYLNGGNGSARLNEVKFLSNDEINAIPSSQFVSLNIKIDATKNEVWNILTKPEYIKTLQPIFDKENKLNWDNTSKVNFKYLNKKAITADFADNLFGNQYIQIDYEIDDYQYVEKFLISENHEAKTSELLIVCGPYYDDFEIQKEILMNWGEKVKELSEKSN